MILIRKIHVMVFVIPLLLACELMPQDNPVLQEKDPEDYFGVCSMELFDFVDEMGYVQIMIDLVMVDYKRRSELNEEEWEEQRKSIIELQDKFLHTLEENDLKFLYVRMGSDPWLSIEVDEQALLFICKHEMVETVSLDRLEVTQ